jgi:small subunit ribosomal protein S1
MNEQRNTSAARGESDFGAMFEQSLKAVRPGEVVHGRVVHVSRDFVTVDIGFKSEGQIPIHEFSEIGGPDVKPGDEIDVYFDGTESEHGTVMLSRAKAEQLKVWRDIEEAFNANAAVEGVVTGKVKGGLKVDVGVPAFLPGSHADLRPARNLDRYIGQRGRFAILKVNRARGKVVSLADYGAFIELEPGVEGLVHVSEMSWTKRVSHPSKVLNPGDEVDVVVLDVDPANRRISLGLKQAEPNPWEMVKINHPIGSHIQGKVKSITDFGIFVGVDEGIDGLVHVSDLHWTKKVKHPSEIYKKGDDVEAVVLGIDVENERISLGVKQLQEDPWNAMPSRYPVGSRVKGTVTSVTDFGVFVELEEGLEGLIHVSQLSTERVDRPSQLFNVGDKVEAEITNVDPRERRIGLSIKALKRSDEREEVDSYLRREREGAKFSFQDILSEELRLDRDEGDRPAKAKGTLEK